MEEGRDKSDWMTLSGLHGHFNFHARQSDLLDVALEQSGTQGPSFIILHTGAALRPDGAQAREAVLTAINEKIQQHEADAIASDEQAEAWRSIYRRFEDMTDDGPWKNPLWEKEILKEARQELRSTKSFSVTPRFQRKGRLQDHRFRRGLSFRDVVCVHEDRYCAFKVDRSKIDNLFAYHGEWGPLFPEIEWTGSRFKWLVFPKDMSGNARIAYLQFGYRAGRLAGDGHTRRFDLVDDHWIAGEKLEFWRS